MMEDEIERRLAHNETLYRRVNEGIQRGRWPGEGDGPLSFRCECARLRCNAFISVTAADYERVRASPRHFLMVPGHEIEVIERVVENRGGYVIVEKAGTAASTAEDADPGA